MLMGVLATRTSHTRPSARSPINMSGNFSLANCLKVFQAILGMHACTLLRSKIVAYLFCSPGHTHFTRTKMLPLLSAPLSQKLLPGSGNLVSAYLSKGPRAQLRSVSTMANLTICHIPRVPPEKVKDPCRAGCVPETNE